MVLGIEPRSTVCKANSLLTLFSGPEPEISVGADGSLKPRSVSPLRGIQLLSRRPQSFPVLVMLVLVPATRLGLLKIITPTRAPQARSHVLCAEAPGAIPRKIWSHLGKPSPPELNLK